MTDFETNSEPFSTYTLSDGSRLKVKHVLVKVEPNGVDASGNPQFNMNFAPIVHLEPRPPINLGGQHSLAQSNQQLLGNWQGQAQNALLVPKKDLQ